MSNKKLVKEGAFIKLANEAFERLLRERQIDDNFAKAQGGINLPNTIHYLSNSLIHELEQKVRNHSKFIHSTKNIIEVHMINEL